MQIKKGVKELCAEYEQEIENMPVEEALQLADDANVRLVDIRDVRELEREGQVPGALHAPRDMLEFWAAPDSPYYKEWLADPDKTYVLYCQSAWRSALAAADLIDMGGEKIAHMAGGFRAWKEAGQTVAERPKKKG